MEGGTKWWVGGIKITNLNNFHQRWKHPSNQRDKENDRKSKVKRQRQRKAAEQGDREAETEKQTNRERD